MHNPPTRIRGMVTAVFLLLLAATHVDAQVRRGRPADQQARWAPPAAGIRVGWDQRANAGALGLQLRLPVVRSGVLEAIPSTDIVFLDGAKDYQYSLEMAWVPGGVRRGVFLTGGVAWRDTPLGTGLAGTRNTFFGYVLGAGARSAAGPLEFELAIRWTFLSDTTYRPNMAGIAVNYPFWSVLPEGRSR